MSKIVLYTTHCPKCRILETKLKAKGVQYVEVTDEAIMQEKNIEFLPMLEVDKTLMDFVAANNFINSYTNG